MLFAINMIKGNDENIDDAKSDSVASTNLDVLDMKNQHFISVKYTFDRDISVMRGNDVLCFIISHEKIAGAVEALNEIIADSMSILEGYKSDTSDTDLFKAIKEKILVAMNERTLDIYEDEDQSDDVLDQKIKTYLSEIGKILNTIQKSISDLEAANQSQDVEFLRATYHDLFMTLKRNK